MSNSVTGMLSGYFSEEMIRERPRMKTSLYNGGSEGVARVREEFREFLRERSMSPDEFWKATMMFFPDREQMYAAIEDAHRFFFDEEPPSGP